MNRPDQPDRDSTLGTLLEAERAIERQLDEERDRARRWLEAKKVEIGRQAAEEEARIETGLRENLAEQKQAAEAEAEAMLAAAGVQAQELSSLDLSSHQALILRHLAYLDPRIRNDRPDVQD
jgi:vacuolar-type H+-ATPase subunit H